MDYDARWQRRFEATQRRQALKDRAIEYKGGRCVICKYDRCASAMVFHHTDPRTKDFSISSRMSWEAIVQELDKCTLVCSNCHAEIHAGYHPSYLVFEDDDGIFEDASFGDISLY